VSNHQQSQVEKENNPIAGNPTQTGTPVQTNDRADFWGLRQKISEVIREFDKLVGEGWVSKEIANLYKTKLNNNISSSKTGYDDLDAPISAEVGQKIIDTIRSFSGAGYSKEAVNAIVAIGTGKGGAQGVIEFAQLVNGKSPEEIIASLKDPALGWQSTITYLYQLEDEKGSRIFKSALEEVFGAEVLDDWVRKKAAEDEDFRARHSNYQRPPSRSLEQISADEYRSNPFRSGELGEKAAEIISTMGLIPGGYCLANTQNALNRAGFGMGNMGPYAYKSLTHFENSGKFIEVTGTKQELEAMIRDRTLPEGGVVYSSKYGDRRGYNGDPYGDVGIIIADGRIVGYDRGSLDSNGQPRLVYGSNNTEVLRVFIPKV